MILVHKGPLSIIDSRCNEWRVKKKGKVGVLRFLREVSGGEEKRFLGVLRSRYNTADTLHVRCTGAPLQPFSF